MILRGKISQKIGLFKYKKISQHEWPDWRAPSASSSGPSAGPAI